MAVRFAHRDDAAARRVAHVRREVEREGRGLGAQWSSDAFWWGYSCGQSRRARLTDAMAASAILNAQMLRVGE